MGSSSASRTVGIGVVGGVTSGLLGVGGGVVMVPGLVLAARTPQRRAHAASLAAIVPTGAVGAALYLARGEIDWALAGLLAAGSVVGAPLGVRALTRLPEAALRVIFVGVMLSAAARIFASSGGVTSAGRGIAGVDVVVALAVGLIAGGYAGLLGVGGGIVMVPAMTIFLDQGQRVAQGTSLLVIVATAIAGSVANHRRGLLETGVALRLGAGGMIGAGGGALLAGHVPDVTLQRIFAGFLIAMAIRLLVAGRTAADREAAC